MKQFNKKLPNYNFFDPDLKLKEYQALQRAHKTNLFRCSTHLLSFTLTFDVSKYTRHRSWKCGKDVNNFKANLKRHFKSKISTIRVNEAHKSGYCHINLIVLLDKPVQVFPYQNKLTGSWRWRLKGLDKMSHYVKRDGKPIRMNKYWDHGVVDVQALACFKSGSKAKGLNKGKMSVSHLFKYCFKDMRSEKNRKENPRSVLQYALEWGTGSRSYSLSGSFAKDFKPAPSDNVNNIVSDLINVGVSKTPDGLGERRISFLGIFPGCAKECWSKNGEKPPDECPYLVDNCDFARHTCPRDPEYKKPIIVDGFVHKEPSPPSENSFAERKLTNAEVSILYASPVDIPDFGVPIKKKVNQHENS
jgi:hypothetical protein